MRNWVAIVMLRVGAVAGVLFCGAPDLVAQDGLKGVALLARVQDGSGAAIAGARVAVRCGQRQIAAAATDTQGEVRLVELPLDRCVAVVTAVGFRGVEREVSPTGDETEEKRISEIIVQSQATGFTDILTRTTPGVAADANGFAHPLGEHADTSISLDGQPITDQQAKTFSNQVDVNIIQSMQATTGAPSVAFGDKTSLVVDIATKSGVGRRPSGTLAMQGASFGTWAGSLTLAAGTKRWGNFVAMSGSGLERFLDSPELRPIHDRGNSASVFDRIDWQPNERDRLHLNLSVGRSWFQTPNSYDNAAVGQDQRSQIRNVNAAFGWTRVVRPEMLFSFVPFYRHDEAQYFPSGNASADLPATLEQRRTLTNTGFRAEES